MDQLARYCQYGTDVLYLPSPCPTGACLVVSQLLGKKVGRSINDFEKELEYQFRNILQKNYCFELYFPKNVCRIQQCLRSIVCTIVYWEGMNGLRFCNPITRELPLKGTSVPSFPP